ncbi:MAG: hypothetical protein IKK53_07780 [Ruminiclostridium sp.]|nr:hypothetical protein [Ruminiclostridium sp.]
MKNTKNAWKLLFTMMKQNKLIWIAAIITIMGVLMLVLVGVEGDMMGDEEHLLSASFTGFGYYMTFFGMLFLFVGLANNRFFMSCPDSKTVFTKVIPTLGAIVNLVILTISLSAVFLGGSAEYMLSDVLIFNALGILFTQLATAVVNVQMGFLLIYVCFVPYTLLIFTTEESTNEFLHNLHLYGFGVPAEISAVICAAVYVISLLVSFRLAEFTYGKRTVKMMNAVAQNPLINK